MSVSVIK